MTQRSRVDCFCKLRFYKWDDHVSKIDQFEVSLPFLRICRDFDGYLGWLGCVN